MAGDVVMASPSDCLTVVSGGIISSVDVNMNFAVGQLTAGTGSPVELFDHVYSFTTTISGTIVDNGENGVVTFVKGGGGNLTLVGANTYTGGTIINQGTLTLGATTPGIVTVARRR